MTILKYKRSFDDLQAKELLAYIKNADTNVELSKLTNKRTLKLYASTLLPSTLSCDANSNPTLYFDADDINRTIVWRKLSDIQESDYDNDRPSKWDFSSKTGDDIDHDSLDGESTSENEKLMAIIESQSERLNQCLNMMNQKQSSQFREKF